MTRKLVTEGLGTAMLVFFAVGAAVFGKDQIGTVGIALAFGLVLLALCYAIGPVTGCHVNPAVTLGIALRAGIGWTEAAGYWAAQVVGGIAGAALVYGMTRFGDVTDQTGALGTNGWGKSVNGVGAFVVETALTFLLVLVVLLVTARHATPGFAGLAIGLTLVVCHLGGIPLTGTSVNPARSIGPALFEGGDALNQLWLFIVAPLVGGALAALVAPFVSPAAQVVLPEPRAAESGKVAADTTGADVPPVRG